MLIYFTNNGKHCSSSQATTTARQRTGCALNSLVFDTKTEPALIRMVNIDFSRTVSLQPPGLKKLRPPLLLALLPTPAVAEDFIYTRASWKCPYEATVKPEMQIHRHTHQSTFLPVSSPVWHFWGSLTGCPFLKSTQHETDWVSMYLLAHETVNQNKT